MLEGGLAKDEPLRHLGSKRYTKTFTIKDIQALSSNLSTLKSDPCT